MQTFERSYQCDQFNFLCCQSLSFSTFINNICTSSCVFDLQTFVWNCELFIWTNWLFSPLPARPAGNVTAPILGNFIFSLRIKVLLQFLQCHCYVLAMLMDMIIITIIIAAIIIIMIMTLITNCDHLQHENDSNEWLSFWCV